MTGWLTIGVATRNAREIRSICMHGVALAASFDELFARQKSINFWCARRKMASGEGKHTTMAATVAASNRQKRENFY